MLTISPFVQIPLSEVELSYVRSSGPGGQNVNKVNSKAVLRWNFLESPSVPDWARARMMPKLANRLTRDGCLLIASDRFRDQGRNREDCFEKLRAMLIDAMTVAKPRKETKPTKGSERRAKVAKQRVSEKKNMRRKPGRGD